MKPRGEGGSSPEMEPAGGESSWQAGMSLAAVLEAAGHEAYLVGGCVRDRLLGREIRDIDIATSALPEQVMELFPKVVPTGLKHGTVTVVRDGEHFEVTTFRHESAYSDARHPDEVVFVRDLREDLARRDFTINAMAVGTNGKTVDPFGGLDDLRRGLVRCVGEAEERFGEDALRMLRGIRFAAEFGFALEEATWSGLLARREKLRHVAMERVGSELDKMMAGRDPGEAVRLLRTSNLLAFAKEPLPTELPDLAGLASDGSERDEESRTVWSRLPNPDARWAALWLLSGADRALALEWARRLKFSVRRGEAIAAVVGVHGRLAGSAVEPGTDDSEKRRIWAEAVIRFGAEAARMYLDVAKAFPSVAGSIRWGEGWVRKAEDWLDRMPASAIRELAVRGDELVALRGLKAGPWVAEELNRLLTLVALEAVPNEAHALKSAAAEGWAAKKPDPIDPEEKIDKTVQ